MVKKTDISCWCLRTNFTCPGDVMLSANCGGSGFASLGIIVSFCVFSGRFFFNLANIDDSLSGNGGISSNTVA